MRALSLILIFTLLFSVCSIAFAADKAVDDDHLVDRVRLKLAGDPDVKGGGLTVDAKNGVVTLSGTVGTDRAKQKATKLAKKVNGVKDVVNEIKVKP